MYLVGIPGIISFQGILAWSLAMYGDLPSFFVLVRDFSLLICIKVICGKLFFLSLLDLKPSLIQALTNSFTSVEILEE